MAEVSQLADVIATAQMQSIPSYNNPTQDMGSSLSQQIFFTTDTQIGA